jgi:hypothetical protein
MYQHNEILHLPSVFDSHHDQLALDVRQGKLGGWYRPIGAFHIYIC